MKNTNYVVHLVWLLVAFMAFWIGYKVVKPVGIHGGGKIDFVINPGNAANDCRIRGNADNRIIEVEPGQWVHWKNTTDIDQIIKFHNPDEVFGVETIIVPAKDTLPLRVLDGAKVDASFEQRFDSCDGGQGPPGIIVCPPGGCP